MSTEEPKAIIRRYLDEAWNKGNVDIIDELMVPDYARYTGTGAPLMAKSWSIGGKRTYWDCCNN